MSCLGDHYIRAVWRAFLKKIDLAPMVALSWNLYGVVEKTFFKNFMLEMWIVELSYIRVTVISKTGF